MTTPTTHYSFPKPIVNADAGSWGVSLNTSLDMIDAQLFTSSGALNSNNLNLASNPATSVSATLSFINGTVPVGQQKRWVLTEDTASEGGGNAGSNFSLSAYSDLGTLTSTPMAFTRATGAVTFSTPASFTAAATFGNTLSVTGAATLTGAATFNSTLAVAGAATCAAQLNCASFASARSAYAGPNFTNIAGLGHTPADGLTIEMTSGSVGLTLHRYGSNGGVARFAESGVVCGSITVSGQNATQFNTTSDVRLKTDAQSFDAGPILDATEVYNFEWKSVPGVRAYGVMAQEAVDVFPDAVHHNEIDDSWGVDYSKYVPLLLNEIKALRTRVAQLEAKL